MNLRINILTVESDLITAKKVTKILDKEGYKNVQIAASVDEAVAAIEIKKPDIVFTGIALDSVKTGIDLGHILKDQYKIPFIYVTSPICSQIVDQLKEISPNAFLTKPFKNEDVSVALKQGFYKPQENKTLKKEDCLIIKDGYDMLRIPYREIIWLKAEKNYTAIHSVSGKLYSVRKGITEVIFDLSDHGFIQIHKSYGVNVNYITQAGSTKIFLKNVELPIGRIYRSRLKKLKKQ